MSREREKALNQAIMAAEPSEGFAPYATAYIEFYDSDVCVKIENRELAGRQRVFDALLSLLTYVESGFGRTGTRRHPVRLLHESLGANETHESVWQLQLDDLSGATRRVVWRSTREWKNGRVIREVIRNSIERVST